jgi:hypothetical protein
MSDIVDDVVIVESEGVIVVRTCLTFYTRVLNSEFRSPGPSFRQTIFLSVPDAPADNPRHKHNSNPKDFN